MAPDRSPALGLGLGVVALLIWLFFVVPVSVVGGCQDWSGSWFCGFVGGPGVVVALIAPPAAVMGAALRGARAAWLAFAVAVGAPVLWILMAAA